MKNMKIYKRATALALATSITLLTGCTGQLEESAEVQQPKETVKPVEFYLSGEQEKLQPTDEKHIHLIVYFGAQAIILRECEGYSLFNSVGGYVDAIDGELSYRLVIDNNDYFVVGNTDNYHCYYSNHGDSIEEIENLAIEKGAKVLKIK